MSELRLSFPASAIAGEGKLTENDVRLLKTEAFPEGIKDTDDAVLLFALHSSCRDTCPQWEDFFIDSISHFIVHHTFPQGSLDDCNALWLERMLSADGLVATDLELELLMNVMAISAHVPDSLKVFALSQLRHAIHGNAGAFSRTRQGPQRGISAHDMSFVRMVVNAGTPAAALPASPSIHRVLLSIDAISNPALNENGWVRLLYTVRAGERAENAVVQPSGTPTKASAGMAA